ncbi:multicopper oxidase family protein [Mycobacterium servetii]|uniref:Multicopper oxidase family protein n=1 Tax=Mycobacterium servetii TaxID=3237418 RepID=A0ABV4BW72_9MYCO
MAVLPTGGAPFEAAPLTRRGFMAAGIAGGLALAACGQSRPQGPGNAAKMADAIAAAEAARPHSGRTVTAALTAQRTEVDLGGTVVRTLAYGNGVPGPPIRAKVGDELVVSVSNRLDRPTSAHWHGIVIRNDMDGAAPATPNIDAGQDFTYRFSVPNPGTYWAHPHVGLQEDAGLYLPLIVDDPADSGYDSEWIVVLDDWTDGVGKSPRYLFDELTSANKPGAHSTPTTTTTSAAPELSRGATIAFDNTTMMYHPMHLHGHTFQLINSDGTPGPRKDTVIVLPKKKLNAVLVADNPGVWQLHCHNTYHMAAGMQTRLDYLF